MRGGDYALTVSPNSSDAGAPYHRNRRQIIGVLLGPRRQRGQRSHQGLTEVGGLDRARYLESAAALVISLLSRGEPPGSILNWTCQPAGCPGQREGSIVVIW